MFVASYPGSADVIEPIFLPAAANCAICHLSLAMRATLRGEAEKIAGRVIADHVARADASISDNLHDVELAVDRVARSVGISRGIFSSSIVPLQT